jgi:hypothetical protein
MVGKHLLDSLAMHPFVDARAAARSPTSAPARPAGHPAGDRQAGLQVTLVESNGKKARFLREAVRQLGLQGRARGRSADRSRGRTRRRSMRSPRARWRPCR